MKLLLLIISCVVCSLAVADSGKIGQIRALTDPGFMAANFSPDGKLIVASKEKYQGLYHVNADAGVTLIDAEVSGYGHQWLPDSSGIITRSLVGADLVAAKITLASKQKLALGAVKESSVAMRYGDTVFTVNEKGAPQILEGALAPESLVFAVAIDDGIYLYEGPKSKRISPEGDRYYSPQALVNGSAVLFEGLTSGIWVYDRKTDSVVNVGQGNHPSWSPDGAYVYYDVEVDDGEKILASELWRATPDGKTKQQLTDTPSVRELRPVVSPDGRQILFEAEGVIYLGAFEESLQ